MMNIIVWNGLDETFQFLQYKKLGNSKVELLYMYTCARNTVLTIN